MKFKKQHAKFFCENCGAEVSENARVCRYCGRFFSSVRCPKCGASGTAEMFDKGCPNCGYAGNKEATISYTARDGSEMRKRLSGTEKRKLKNAFDTYKNRNSSTAQSDNSLPAWIYVVTACILAAVLAAVYGCIK